MTGPVTTDPAARLAACLNLLCRAVAQADVPLPPVAGIHLSSDSFDVLLSGPATGPPPPFTSMPLREPLCWSATHPDGVAVPVDGPPGPADPFPGLCTAGRTEGGGYLVLDLAAIPVMGCAGAVEIADQTILAIATELAGVRRRGWLDLILVGCDRCAGLEECDHAADVDEAIEMLAARAGQVRRPPGAAQGTTLASRPTEADDPGSGLAVLVSRVAPTPEQMSDLLDVADPAGGVAALVAGDVRAADGRVPPGRFWLGSDPGDGAGAVATITLPGWGPERPLVVRAQRLIADEADEADDDVLADHQPLNGTLAAHPAPAGDVVRTADSNDVLAAVLPWTRLVAAPVDPAAGLPGPLVSVLGPVEITGDFDPLRPDQAELVLALALHAPLGLADTVLCGLLGPDADHPRALDVVRGLVARTRDRLGAAGDDRPYVLSQGGGVYAAHPGLALDWAIFSERAGRGLADENADDLRAALSLVRGQPFGGRGSWWVDIGLIEAMTEEIVEVAHLLSRLELHAGNPRAARRAARSGLAADGAAERLWRALMSAEQASGNPAGVMAAWTGCLDAIARIDPGAGPDPETRRLFGRLSGGAVSAGQ